MEAATFEAFLKLVAPSDNCLTSELLLPVPLVRHWEQQTLVRSRPLDDR